MLAARITAMLVVALALVSGAHAQPERGEATAAPQALRGFLLRADETKTDTFARTPSFAWEPVRGALRYEFQLSTSDAFREGGIVYASETVKLPVLSLPMALPWMTGNPYALYARVRAVLADSITPWSEPFGFNVRWETLPAPMPSYPGLVRWTPVEGATGYEVFFVEPGKRISTRTNVADQREYYLFHQSSIWTGTVRWRVRATRMLYGSRKNNLPAVSYGPWSPVYTAVNPTFATGKLGVTLAVSDVVTSATATAPHRLTPGFVFSGNQSLLGVTYELYRVYVFTDKDCVNRVFRGAIVGGPAYAPRASGPIALPKDDTELADARSKFLDDGEEGKTWTLDDEEIKSSESDDPAKPDTPTIGEDEDEEETDEPTSGSPANGSSSSTGGSSSQTGSSSGASSSDEEEDKDSNGSPSAAGGEEGADTALPVDPEDLGAPVDLWDLDWPSGRYYWSVVPVLQIPPKPFRTTVATASLINATTLELTSVRGLAATDTILIGRAPTAEEVEVTNINGKVVTLAAALRYAHAVGEPIERTKGELEYQDQELTDDTCRAARMHQFGKTSEPTVATATTPYVSGLSPAGRVFAAADDEPKVYGAPLVAWMPALGAQGYEVQWSKTEYPFRAEGNVYTFATSASLPLGPGTWYYRVRGLDLALVGPAQKMAWSDPVQVGVAKPTFTVLGAVKTKAGAKKGVAAKPALVRMSVPSDGFSVAVPRGWQKVELEKGSPVRFAAASPQTEQGFFTNMNIVVGSGRGSLTLKAWADSLKKELNALTLVPGTLATATMRLPAGPAVRLAYRMKTVDQREVSIVQYAVDAAGKAFVLTYTSAPSLASKYSATFAASAASFRLTK